MYSNPWSEVKYAPKIIVMAKPVIVSFQFPADALWWAQVTDAPEERRIIEFNSGIPIGLNGWIPFGGHIDPNSIVGLILEKKYAQKNDTKNKTSDKIKR